MTKKIYTFCRICEMRCGLAVTVQDKNVASLSPFQSAAGRLRRAAIAASSARFATPSFR